MAHRAVLAGTWWKQPESISSLAAELADRVAVGVVVGAEVAQAGHHRGWIPGRAGAAFVELRGAEIEHGDGVHDEVGEMARRNPVTRGEYRGVS